MSCTKCTKCMSLHRSLWSGSVTVLLVFSATQAALSSGAQALFAQPSSIQPNLIQTVKPDVPQIITNVQGQIVAIGAPSQVRCVTYFRIIMTLHASCAQCFFHRFCPSKRFLSLQQLVRGQSTASPRSLLRQPLNQHQSCVHNHPYQDHNHVLMTSH